MKKFLAIFLSLIILVFSFSACNKSTEKETDEPIINRPDPVAQFSPNDIDPGRQKDSVYTSDLWYPDANDGSYFYLQKSDILSITFVNDTEKNTYDCSVTDDNHLVSEGICNIVFYDAFNCYDFERQEWYTRGNVDKIKTALSGKTLVNSNDAENQYVFGDDGTTVYENYKGTEYTGIWTMITETVMVVTFGNDDYSYTFDIDADDEGNVLGFSQRGGREFRFIP